MRTFYVTFRKRRRGKPAVATLHDPVTTAMNVGITNEGLGPDGITWAHARPVGRDKFGKLFVIAQSSSNNHYLLFSSDAGVTWGQSAWNEGFLVRAAAAYDSRNDILHLLWRATDYNDGVIYRRYTFARDGANNITNLVRVAGVNLQVDNASNMAYEHPSAFWLSDAQYGPYGALLALWDTKSQADSSGELRASLRILSNTTADNTAANWVAPGPVATPGATFNTPAVPYTKFATSVGGDMQSSVVRCANGDLVVAYYRNFAWYVRGAVFQSGSGRWAAPTAEALISLVARAGTDTGYTLKRECASKVVERASDGRCYVGLPTWKSNTDGDTWSIVAIDGHATPGPLMDVYSVGGKHSFAPTGDIALDADSGSLLVSWIVSGAGAEYPFIQARDATSLAAPAAPIQVQNTQATDIPCIAEFRVPRAGQDCVLLMYRDCEGTPTPPYSGFVSTVQIS